MMKIVLAAAAVAAVLVSVPIRASATAAHATAIIGGRVVDSVDQRPLGGVQVDVFDDSSRSRVQRAVATTMTRNDGSFSLLGLRSGIYRLEMVKRGYALEIVTGFSLEPDERILVSRPFGLRSAVVTTGLGATMETHL